MAKPKNINELCESKNYLKLLTIEKKFGLATTTIS